MCFHSQQTKKPKEIKERFNAEIATDAVVTLEQINGFNHPATPVISNTDPHVITNFTWGLIPRWAMYTGIQKQTLNAKIETLHEKPSFKNNIQNRCLIISDGFFEWQWLDSKGKRKQKHLITVPNNQAFAFAGIYDTWQHPETEEHIYSYSILTTQANSLMAEIHNSKKRMPIIVPQSCESDWLAGMPIAEAKKFNPQLIASPVFSEGQTLSLF